MKRRSIAALAAVTAVGALTLAACGSSGGGGGTTTTTPTTTYGQGNTSIVNPSSHTGGTLTFENSGSPDSTDPGNTYYGYMWNFARLYTRTLMTFKSVPGNDGLQVVPDLATGPGVVSNNGLTWTYTIKPNIKFEDGTTVTTTDIKYAVERSFATDVFSLGPVYFAQLLNDPSYKGPYKDKTPGHLGLTSVTTPNATTIEFHLAKPFADFNYVAMLPQTAPVEAKVDLVPATGGANYQLHPISTGPYMFQSYTLDKKIVLVPNPHWDASTDPNRKQLASQIVVNLGVNAADVDNRVISTATTSVDMPGTGVQTAARSEILLNAAKKANADDALGNRLWFAYINTVVIPNVHCRRAIEYATNKVSLHGAYGGSVGGDIASTVMPPNISGYQQFDLYNAVSQSSGDLVNAKKELALCGKPNGFSTNIAFRSDRPREVNGSAALQEALARVGITATPQGFPSGKYYGAFAGVPAYVHAHNLGIALGGWAPDWNDGYGMLFALLYGPAITKSGNTNIGELNDPAVNKLFDAATASTDPAVRLADWAQIDKLTMQDAAMLPIVYAKGLLYRNPNLTNVYVQAAYGQYNYAVLGVAK